MSGKVFSVSLIVFCLIFGITLFYFQLFAYYVKVDNLSYIKVNDELIPVQNYQGIDSASSALKLRGCFTVDPNVFEKEPIAAMPTPLAAPFWFRCFDHEFLHDQIEKGNSKVYLAKENEYDGIDRLVAVFKNGTAFQWRQLNPKFADK